jgi:hypothetical protein
MRRIPCPSVGATRLSFGSGAQYAPDSPRRAHEEIDGRAALEREAFLFGHKLSGPTLPVLSPRQAVPMSVPMPGFRDQLGNCGLLGICKLQILLAFS